MNSKKYMMMKNRLLYLLILFVCLIISVQLISQVHAIRLDAPGQWERTTLNSYNLPYEFSVDSSADQSLDYRRQVSYNDQGQPTLIKREVRKASNWKLTYKKQLIYNSNHQLEHELFDRNGNGLIDRRRKYSYNKNLWVDTILYDPDGIGKWESMITYEYDKNGNRTREVLNFNFSTVPDRIDERMYEKDLLVQHKIYEDGKGIKHRYKRNLVYNSEGLLTLEITDSDGDGKTDRSLQFKLNTFGQVIESQLDKNGDGKIDEYSFNTYNKNNQLTLSEKDNDGDGDIDRKKEYQYNKDGLVSLTQTDQTNDGSWDYITYLDYDGRGNIIRNSRDIDGNGKINFKQTFQYDQFDNLIYQIEDHNGNGFIDYSQRNFYDINRNLVRSEKDINGNGNLDLIEHYSFSNPIRCIDLSSAPTHQIRITIPEKGNWKFSLCGSNFINQFTLSKESFCDTNFIFSKKGCPLTGDAEVDVSLQAGEYFLSVMGKKEFDQGIYQLNIERNSSTTTKKSEDVKFSVFPNPCSDHLIVNSENSSNIQLKVIDISGKVIISKIYKTGDHLDIHQLTSGAYTLAIYSGKNPSFLQFIKM